MAPYTTTTTFGQTGIREITTGFPTKLVEITASPAIGQEFEGILFAHGWTDLTRKKCSYGYLNVLNGRSISGTNTQKILQVWGENPQGDIVVILEAAVLSVTATKVRFDVTVPNVNIQVSIKCEG